MHSRMDVLALLTPLNLALYAIAINFAAFAAFGLDKMLAEARDGGFSDACIVGVAFMGGAPGALAGRRLFRHKTRKQPFSRELHKIALLQLFAAASLAGWTLAG